MLVRDGIDLVKYWFSVGPDEQARRFQQRLDSPVKRWKFSDMDLQSYVKWDDYSHAKDRMMAYTDTDACRGTWSGRTASGARASTASTTC